MRHFLFAFDEVVAGINSRDRRESYARNTVCPCNSANSLADAEHRCTHEKTADPPHGLPERSARRNDGLNWLELPMVAHTGFLVFARRLAAGVRASQLTPQRPYSSGPTTDGTASRLEDDEGGDPRQDLGDD
jgi:hypothetical protein